MNTAATAISASVVKADDLPVCRLKSAVDRQKYQIYLRARSQRVACSVSLPSALLQYPMLPAARSMAKRS